MRIVCISDTHYPNSADWDVDLPEGDMLLHGGDATFMGTIAEVSSFNFTLGKLKKRYTHGIFFTPGNHDWFYEKNELLARDMTYNARVLIHETAIVGDINLFMSPFQPWFNNWAFNLDRGSIDLKDKWATIPSETSVLVTHGPPLNILDKCPSGERVGCYDLLQRVKELKQLKIHSFGHIHHSYGQIEIEGTKFINASMCNEQYETVNKPIVIDI